MDYFTKKEGLVIIFLIIIVLTISLISFLKNNMIRKEDSSDISNLFEELIEDGEPTSDTRGDVNNTNKEIMVHVSGQVYNPGLVILKEGDRVIDAIELAGGLKKDADLDKINLAKKLEDEDKIFIPRIGENSVNLDINMTDSYFIGDGKSSRKVNINTSSKEELMTLPGIGDVLAERIIEYRENNPFKDIEDIKNVSGIGEKKFQDLKDLIITR